MIKDYSQIARKITITLFVTQSLASAALIVSNTVNTIVGAKLSGNIAWAGIPSALLQLGAAFTALAVGASMDRIGRRGGLFMGLSIGILGAGIAAFAIPSQSFLIFLGGLAALGVARAAMQLARFSAAEVHPPEKRGRAISNVVIGGAVGSVLGPLIVGPAGLWVQNFNMDELVGPYLATFILLSLASLVVFIWLRPDPRDVGKKIAEIHPETIPYHGSKRSFIQILRTPAALVAVSAMVIGQMVMVMIMVITSLHMKNYQHNLTDISMVISAHTFGMYAFSFVSGRLTDWWGRGPVILSGILILILASVLAPLSAHVLWLSISLFLLGLGWNFCYVGGSTLLSDQLSPAERATTQGANDMLIGLASAAGSLLSGVVFASLGYAAMGIFGALVSLIPLGLTGLWMVRGRKTSWGMSADL